MGLRGVAVGIRLTPYPPHRSGRADFPHPALASGSDVQTARRIRTADMGRRQPAADEPFHSFPLEATMPASPAQSAMPEVRHGETKMGQSMPENENYRRICQRQVALFFPFKARSRYVAALINARCVNAWGKFPRCCPLLPSSSEYNPR